MGESRLKNLGIKSILILMLVFGTLVSVSVVGLIGYYTGARALDDSIFEHLSSVRASKAQQIESYFAAIRNQVETLAGDPTITSAMTDFRQGFELIPDISVPDTWLSKLRDYYDSEYIPRLGEGGGAPTAEHYLPGTAAGRYLQHQYVAGNSYPVGRKNELVRADDGTAYDAAHQRYHANLLKIVEKFNYYDLFLIDLDGNIVYSVFKETDFATNLDRGPYRYSQFAEVFGAVRASPHPAFVKMVDFDHYAPSYGQPAAFIASPIFVNSQIIGALALQISVDEINRITTGDRRWAEQGLGESGETYLVGEDNRMRSISRFLIEDKEQYLAVLRKINLNPETIERIDRHNTSILEQPVPDRSKQSLASATVVDDYRGVRVLSSRQKLTIPDVYWRIQSEIDLSEARVPIRKFGRRVLVASSIIAVLITLIAMALAALFVRPINSLIAGARRITAGDNDVLISAGSQPEFTELANSFNSMVNSLRGETRLSEEESQQREQVLALLLPRSVSERMSIGVMPIAEGFDNVSVLCAEIIGLSDLSVSKAAEELVGLINELVADFEEISEMHGVEKFKTQGNTYIGVSGLSAPRLDHARCTVDFSVAIFDTLHRFNRAHRTKLSMRIGIDSGPVVAGVVGQRSVVYDLVGETVNVADRLRSQAKTDTILVSEEVRERLGDMYRFDSSIEVLLERGQRMTASVLTPNAADTSLPTDLRP